LNVPVACPPPLLNGLVPTVTLPRYFFSGSEDEAAGVLCAEAGLASPEPLPDEDDPVPKSTPPPFKLALIWPQPAHSGTDAAAKIRSLRAKRADGSRNMGHLERDGA
jgi:hypothetical protein